MKILPLKQTLCAIALTSTVFTVSADWTLSNADSSLDFISIKNQSFGEVHTFKELAGSLKDNGEVTVGVSLSSVDTKIPTRDERMKKVLFETVAFPKATVSTKVNMTQVNGLKTGESLLQNLELKLSLHGSEQEVEADMRITALTDDKLLVSTVKPIVINTKDFKLDKGIDMLRELAKLSSISTSSPVTANFIFEK